MASSILENLLKFPTEILSRIIWYTFKRESVNDLHHGSSFNLFLQLYRNVELRSLALDNYARHCKGEKDEALGLLERQFTLRKQETDDAKNIFNEVGVEYSDSLAGAIPVVDAYAELLSARVEDTTDGYSTTVLDLAADFAIPVIHHLIWNGWIGRILRAALESAPEDVWRLKWVAMTHGKVKERTFLSLFVYFDMFFLVADLENDYYVFEPFDHRTNELVAGLEARISGEMVKCLVAEESFYEWTE